MEKYKPRKSLVNSNELSTNPKNGTEHKKATNKKISKSKRKLSHAQNQSKMLDDRLVDVAPLSKGLTHLTNYTKTAKKGLKPKSNSVNKSNNTSIADQPQRVKLNLSSGSDLSEMDMSEGIEKDIGTPPTYL